MAYTAPKTWTNEPLIAGDMNTNIRDNIIALHEPPSALYDAVEGTNLSLTSSTWADVDATEGNFLHTITTAGGDILIIARWVCGLSGNGVICLDVAVDGVAYGVTTLGAAEGLHALWLTSAGGLAIDAAVSFTHVLTGISAGSHAIKLRYKLFSIATMTVYRAAGTSDGDVSGLFLVREFS